MSRFLLVGRPDGARRPGGDTCQRAEVANELVRRGLAAEVIHGAHMARPGHGDIVVLHDLPRLASWGSLPQRTLDAGARLVLWPLWHDTAAYDRHGRGPPLSWIVRRRGAGLGTVAARNGFTVGSFAESARAAAAIASDIVASGPVETSLLETTLGIRASLVVPAAIPTSWFDDPPRPEAAFGGRAFALSIGRIEPLKASMHALDAALDAEVPIVFVGRIAADRHPLFAAAFVARLRRAGPERVRWIAHAPAARVRALLDAATVHLSCSWAESAGRATLEAVARGVAVVFPACGEWPALFDGAPGAYLCPPGGGPALAVLLDRAFRAGRPTDAALRRSGAHLRWDLAIEPFVQRISGSRHPTRHS